MERKIITPTDIGRRLEELTAGVTDEEAQIIYDAVDRLFNAIEKSKALGELRPVYPHYARKNSTPPVPEYRKKDDPPDPAPGMQAGC